MKKRGLSPILATVLLIGFAVALGAMIMNWTRDLAEDPCKNVQIQVYQSGQLLDPGVCYNPDNTIKIKIQNKGPVDVARLRMTTMMGIADSAVLANQILEQNVPFSSIERAKDNAWITIVPEVSFKENITSCDKQGTRIDKLLTPCP
jgi:flagellin-like protein